MSLVNEDETVTDADRAKAAGPTAEDWQKARDQLREWQRDLMPGEWLDLTRTIAAALAAARAEADQLREAMRALAEVADERARQDAKWGKQNHPDGTGLAYSVSARDGADRARRDCQTAAGAGRCTWRLILAEEVAEAFAEDDPTALRAELIQVAAVAVQWAEAIDRRAAARVRDLADGGRR